MLITKRLINSLEIICNSFKHTLKFFLELQIPKFQETLVSQQSTYKSEFSVMYLAFHFFDHIDNCFQSCCI